VKNVLEESNTMHFKSIGEFLIYVSAYGNKVPDGVFQDRSVRTCNSKYGTMILVTFKYYGTLVTSHETTCSQDVAHCKNTKPGTIDTITNEVFSPMMEGLVNLAVFDDDENHDSHNEGEEEFSALFQSVVDDPTIATTTIASFSSSSTSSLMEPSGGIWMDEMEEEDIILSLSSSPSLTPTVIATVTGTTTTATISALSIVTRPFIAQGTLAIYLNPQNQVYCLEFFYEHL